MNGMGFGQVNMETLAVKQQCEINAVREPRNSQIELALERLHSRISDLMYFIESLRGDVPERVGEPVKAPSRSPRALFQLIDAVPEEIDGAEKNLNSILGVLRDRLA